MNPCNNPKSNFILEELVKNPHLIKAEMCRRNFFYFAKEFWSTIVDEEPIWNWHIEKLCNKLQKIAFRVIARKQKKYDFIVNIPPGTTKTMIVTVLYNAWVWIAVLPKEQYKVTYKKRGKDIITGASSRFITGSYDKDLSLEHADLARDVIQSDKYLLYFPELTIRSDKSLKSNFKNNKNGSRFSCSVGSRVTGVHAHFLIVDDPINPKQALSDKERVNANNWIDHTLSTRKVNKAVTVTIVVMQRLHLDDPTGHMVGKKKKNICHWVLPGHTYLEGKETYEVKPKEFEKYYVNGLLDPVRLSPAVLEELSTDLTGFMYSAQIGQKPVIKGGLVFKVENLHLPKEINEKRIISCVRYWDKAGTQDGGKRTAGVKIAKVFGYPFDYIVLHVVKGQWSAGIREERIKQTAALDGNSVRIWIEQEPGSGGKESAENSVINLAGYIVNVDKVTGEKFTRMEALAAQVEHGRVAVLADQPWTQAFIDEMENCGPGSEYVDQCDAASGGFNKIAMAKVGVTW